VVLLIGTMVAIIDIISMCRRLTACNRWKRYLGRQKNKQHDVFAKKYFTMG
jgi:hypothetical protein